MRSVKSMQACGARRLSRIQTCLLLLLTLSCFSVSAEPIDHQLPEGITYCVDPDWMPYEGIRDGVHVGMSAAYIELLQQKTGIQFTLVETRSWPETLQFLQQGRCQLTPMLNRSAARDEYLEFTDVYFRSPNVLVSIREQPFLQSMENIGARSLAVPEGYRLIEYIQQYYPDTQLVLVEHEQAGLRAVASGRADLFIGSLYSINQQIQQESLYQLKVAGWVGLEDELRMGVVQEHKALVPVLNSALASISEAEQIAIYRRWTQIDVLDNTNYTLIWQVAGSALFIIVLLSVWNYRSRNFNRRLQEKNQQLEQTRTKLELAIKELEYLSNHDPLTHTYNRNHFDQSMKRQQRRQQNDQDAFCLIVLDIDHFKRINDQHGHVIGDQVLQELANVLIQQVREGDQVTRWGGEEFVILCQKTSLHEAKVLAERIRQRISQQLFAESIQLSCSFGVAEQGAKEPLMSCFERADKSLYQAKAEGRDRICLAQPATTVLV